MMRSLAAALALASASLLVPAVPAFGADTPVKLTLDGRPVDRDGKTAMKRNGVIYADVVDLVKSFNGLLTFQGNAVVVTITGINARFTEGSRTALINEGAVTMPGQTLKINGDFYVPLETFITKVAKAKLKTNPAKTQADIAVNANPS